MEKLSYFNVNALNIIEGNLSSKKSKIAIIIPRFNYLINNNLLNGSIDVLTRIGKLSIKNIDIIKIPGSYEIPIIAKIISSYKKHHGIITLGSIIKGETIQYKTITNAIVSQISQISIQHNIPISLGILITDNTEQALNRSGIKHGNKGSEAALTILEMINVIKKIKNISKKQNT